MPTSDQINRALRRLLAEQEAPGDITALREKLLDGSLSFSEGSGGITVGGSASGVFVTGSNNRIVLELDEGAQQAVRRKLYPASHVAAPPPPSLVFLGRARQMQEINKLLVGGRVAVVEGWPGVGKTSMAGALAWHGQVRANYPDGVLWTSLGPIPNIFSALAGWGRALGAEDLLRIPTLEELAARLKTLLTGKRMLLIADDIWDIGHAVPFLNCRANDCAMLFTTRQPQVAEGFTNHTVDAYKLPVLDEDAALGLLSALSPTTVDRDEVLCRSLVRDLEYLPLSIHVAGRLLRSEERMGWGVAQLVEDIRTGAAIIRERAPEDRVEDGGRPTVKALLQKSTDFLDAQTLECFAYLGVFAPKPATFDTEAMTAVWGIEDAKSVIRSLVGHGLLEATGNGRFQMHALLVAHARSFLSDE